MDDEESLEPGAGIAVDPIDSKEAPPPQEKRLLNLRGNLASRVRGEDLSNEEAWEEMRMALTSSQLGDETRDGDDSTAIEETSWGTLKAAASRGWQCARPGRPAAPLKRLKFRLFPVTKRTAGTFLYSVDVPIPLVA